MALRTKLRTIVMRTKLVTIIKMAGTRLRMVSRRKNCSAVALWEPPPPSCTLTPGAVMLVPAAAPEPAAPLLQPTNPRLSPATANAGIILLRGIFAAVVRVCIVAESAAGGPWFSRESAPDFRSRKYRVCLSGNFALEHVEKGARGIGLWVYGKFAEVGDQIHLIRRGAHEHGFAAVQLQQVHRPIRRQRQRRHHLQSRRLAAGLCK